jgi:hypothetical protein
VPVEQAKEFGPGEAGSPQHRDLDPMAMHESR